MPDTAAEPLFAAELNAGILRGMGNSTASLFFLMVSCVINVVLDVALVAGLGMDVTGAALAELMGDEPPTQEE